MPRLVDRKQQGEVSELAFMHKAVGMGLKVARPWGENNRYDFIVDCEGWLTRVQVKSAAVAHGGGYRVGTGSGRRSKQAYTRKQIDVLAAYIVPEDLWYLIPVTAFAPRKTIRLYPGRAAHRLAGFRDRWALLRWSLGRENVPPQCQIAHARARVPH